MPRKRAAAITERQADGRFRAANPFPNRPTIPSGENIDRDDSDKESLISDGSDSDWAPSTDDELSEAESASSNDRLFFLERGRPQTRVEYRTEQQRRRLVEQSTRRAEQYLDGNIDRAGGAKDKTGVKRGPYKVGGDSDRSVRRKLAQFKEEAAQAPMSAEVYERRLASIQASGKGKQAAQKNTLASYFSKPLLPTPPAAASTSAAAPTPVQVRVLSSPDADREAPDVIPDVRIRIESPSPPSLGHTEMGNTPPSSDGEIEPVEVVEKEAEVDRAAEWTEVVEEDLPTSLADLHALAVEGLRNARKTKEYRSELMFASLVDFFKWTPRQGRVSASLRVARNHGRGPAFARVLREHARHLEMFQSLKPSRQGKRIVGGSLLDNEAVLLGLQRYLRTLEPGKITPALLQQHLNTVLFPTMSELKKKSITVRQARRFLWKLGYRRKRHSKGVYWDGHERKDVKKRRVVYLSEMEIFQKLSRVYDGDDMETEILPTLGDGEKEHVLYFHDESAFHANDYQRDYWLAAGQQVLKKKEKGRLIMVSDFISVFGRLALSAEELEAEKLRPAAEQLPVCDARVIICPSSKPGADKYWDMEQMIAQMEQAIKLHDRKHPDKRAVFVFDNSSAHESLSKDALTVTKMNVNPGGKNVPHMHDTVIPLSNPHGHGGKVQKMEFDCPLPDDHPHKKHEGQPKGIRVILEERGYLNDGKKRIGECQLCKKQKARKPHLDLSGDQLADIDASDADDTEEEDERPKDCCLRRMLSLEEDFVGEQSLLYKIITKAGHICIFLPKFHPELNPIELYWGWVKRYFRERCTGDFKKARLLVEEALDACPVSVIRRFFRRVERYMSVYRLGVTGIAAEYAVKKYRSHRAVRQIDLDEAEKSRKEADTKLRTVGPARSRR